MNEEQQSKKTSPNLINLEEIMMFGSQKLEKLIGLQLLAVVEVSNQEERGWSMKMEFIEREGIPNTMDLIGLYEAFFDHSGNLLNYSRIDMRKRGDSYH